MRDHIIGEDYELWDIVTDGPLATMKKNAEAVDVPKTRSDCTSEDLKKWEKNAKAKKWLVCGLGPDEYNRIQSCTIVKEIWDTLQVAHEGTPQEGEIIQEMYTRFTTLTNELKSIGRVILEEEKVEKILTRVLPVSWENKITVIQELKNISTLKLDELIGNLTAYELRRQTMKMDALKKEMSLAFRIIEGVDLEYDEMILITKDFKKYLIRGKGPSRSRSYNKPRVPEKQTNEGCYKCGRTDHHIKNCPQWEIEWKKERVEGRNRKKEQGESSDEDLEDKYGDEQALMEIGESDEESELSKECVILKAKCKNLELMASESESKNTELKNQVHELDTIVLELRYENLKLKLGTGKKKADHTQLTLEENVGKIKDELYKRDEQIRVLKEDLNKGSSQIWYMDSGCPKHMTCSKNQFLSLEDLKGGNVSFGNEKKGEIIWVGKKLYRGMIGSLLYLTAIRPDIVFSIGLCTRFQANPKKSHLIAIKKILRYLKGTTDLCLWYPKGSNFNLLGYADIDYTGFLVDRKSTSGMAQFLGSCLVSWATKKQNSVALSTDEAEYVVVASCCAQLL
ncbi:intracellular protein transport protein USO1-like [Nicotiana sylvestris]|uniref:intracellular protein transport protein USO1-like n=1 Tax=Nicotiana sylvestris TaxID=4096 RepID=UPI00388C6802